MPPGADARKPDVTEAQKNLLDGKSGGSDALLNDVQRQQQNQRQLQNYLQSSEKGTNAYGEINQKPDPNRIRDTSEQLTKPPVDGNTRGALDLHRQMTSTTGFGGERTVTDANGNKIKGIEHFDKKTGVHTLTVQGDNGLTHYKIMDGGRNLQKLDKDGKAEGDPVRIRNSQAERNNGGDANDRAKTRPDGTPRDGRDGGDKQTAEKPGSERGHRKGDGTDTSKEPTKQEPGKQPVIESTKPGDTKPAVSPENPSKQHGGHYERPTVNNEEGKSFRPGRDHGDRGDRGDKTNPTNNDGTKNSPTVNPYDNGVNHRRIGGDNNPNPNPNGGDNNRNNRGGDNNNRGDGDNNRGWNRGGDQNRNGDQNRGNQNGADQNGRRDFNNQNPQDRMEARRQHDARVMDSMSNQNMSSERAAADARRAEIAARIEQMHAQQHQNPNRPGADFGRQQDRMVQMNMDGRNPAVRPEGPSVRSEMIGRAAAMEAAMDRQAAQDRIGRMNPAMEARLGMDLQNHGNRAAMLEMMTRFENGKLGQTGREGDMGNFLKGLKPADFAGMKDFLSQDSKMAALQFSRLDARAQVQLQDMLTLTGRANGRLDGAQASTTDGIKLTGRINELVGRESLDRVPTPEQSRMMLRELFGAKDVHGERANLTTSQELNMSRLLGQREADQKVAGNFTLKGENALLVKDLIEKIGVKETVTQAKVEAIKAVEATTVRATETAHNATLEATGRVVDRAQAATAAEMAAQKINEQKTEAKPAENVRVAERAVDASIAQQVQIAKSTDAADNKYGMPVEDKTLANKTGEKEKEKDEKIEQKRELTPEELAALLARKVKEQKDKAGKEKDQAAENNKKDPTKRSRQRYRVRQNDTLHALALRFLQDETLAPAIYHINRNVIPLTTHGGKHYSNPQINTLIWIPGDDDIEAFKNAGAHKKYSHIGFKGVKYGSAAEELNAHFGGDWKSAEAAASAAEVENKNAERRNNIAKLLGPFKKEEAADGRIRYNVRLGDSLKSIALKHPALQQVELWKLIAHVNELSTEVDTKGSPVSTLKRGDSILLPNAAEIEHFKKTGELPGSPSQEEASNGEVAATDEDNSGSSNFGADVSAMLSSFTPFGFNLPQAESPAAETTQVQETSESVQAEQTDFAPAVEEEETEEEDHDPSVAAFQPGSQKVWNSAFNKFRAEATARSVDDLETFMNQVDGSETLILSETARLVACGKASALADGYNLSLEILQDGNWEAVVKYEISESACTHQTYDGSYRRSRPLNLSHTQVFELAKNDLSRNWQNHISAYGN